VIQRMGNSSPELAVEELPGGTSMATNILPCCGHNVSFPGARENVGTLKNERTTHECH
jgi:hypothetical protein